MIGPEAMVQVHASVTLQLQKFVKEMEIPDEVATWLRGEFRRVAGDDARLVVPIKIKGEIDGKKALFFNIPALTSGGPRHEFFRASMKFLIEMWSVIFPATQEFQRAIASAQQRMTEGDELLAIGRMVGVKDKNVIWDSCLLAFCERFPEFKSQLGYNKILSRVVRSVCVGTTLAPICWVPIIGSRAARYLADHTADDRNKVMTSVVLMSIWNRMVTGQQMFLDSNLVVFIGKRAPIITHVKELASAPLARDCYDGRFPFPFLDHFKTLFQEAHPTEAELDDIRRWYEYEYEMRL